MSPDTTASATAVGTDAAALQAESQDTKHTGSDRLWSITPIGLDPAFLLARANALSISRMHTALATLGLKARPYSLLAIAAADARPTQRELSEFLQLDPSQIVSLIDELEKRGLVRREPDPRDRRAKVVVATDEGRALAEQARATVVESDSNWFSRIPEADQQRFFEILRDLATA